MGTVRHFQPTDIIPVADLFQKVFRRGAQRSSPSLQSYFEKLYFSHPSYDESMSSLVYVDEKNNVRGFIGGLSTEFEFKKRKVTALVAGSHMVDPDLKDPIAGALLLREFTSGPQDFTYTDTANSISIELWRAIGGDLLFPYSTQWVYPLRPGYLFNVRLKNHRGGDVLSWLSYPACRLVDVIHKRVLACASDENVCRLRGKELDANAMFNSFETFRNHRALFPSYGIKELNWRLSLAESKQKNGKLFKIAVFDKEKLQGWYLVYIRDGEEAHVLQLIAHPASLKHVLNHLFTTAQTHGCSAIHGDVDPKYLVQFRQAGCDDFHVGGMAMLHTQDPEIRNAILSGDAYISALEGERWTRLQADEF
ncbi:hypothetical protein [Tichowtungia aerotolerans]|uniref:GNAT family N-acetyltransferase n=1 Tax=Tichowtungia aerotolerans TaxID=2697043 RepID=A0A6P1MFD4_9BACT|nr:hypothetical protein [Tichowtungia aerotolerans]QHI69775.1 hypothetical protein GT409_10035 [Tichowtungia aerotolerans]